MNDITFDINTRDLVISSGDFATTGNPSVQNGSIIKEARCLSPLSPIWGIGLMDIINAPVEKTNYEMSRWSQQAKDDGAVKATSQVTNDPVSKITNINIQIQYND